MADELLTLFCPTCAGERPVETPPCPDGHGDACPDRACVDCGTALVLDVALIQLAAGCRPHRTSGGLSHRGVARWVA